MTSSMRSFVRLAVASLALAAASTRAQVPGPERIEVLHTDDGARVLLAGVGVGTSAKRAAERLGGAGPVAVFFGGGPILHQGEIDGSQCGLMATPEDTGRIRDIYLECTGDRPAMERISNGFRRALSGLPSLPPDPERPDELTFADGTLVVRLGLERAGTRDDGGPWEFRMSVYDREWMRAR